MSLSFRKLSIAASCLCIALAAGWLLFPQFILGLWQIGGGKAAVFTAHRSAALFLGFGAMLWLARDAEKSPARDAMAAGFSVGCAALAVLGTLEFAAGNAGAGIWLAVIVEAALSVSFFRFCR